MRRLTLAILAAMICDTAIADSVRKISVYRSTSSPFSSGEIQSSILEKGLTRTSVVPWWEVQTATGQIGFVPADHLFTPQQMATVEVTDGTSHLKLSRALTRTTTELRKSPDIDSKSILKLSEGKVIEILNFAISKNPEENWVRAKVNGRQGFLDLRDLVTGLDLVSSIALTNSDLERVHYTLGGWMFTLQGRRVGAGEVTNVDWRPQAIVARETHLKSSTKPSSDKITNLVAGSRVKLLRPVQQNWAHSFVPRLGLMAWTDQVLSVAPAVPTTLSTEDLFQRGLFDMATHPSRPELRVASAKGIFLTQNGQDWRAIKGFQEQNQAVSFTPAGHLIIGDRISSDLGATFEPLIKWDTVTPIIKAKAQRVPSWMRITSVHSRGEEITVGVEVGRGALVHLVSNDLGQSWKLAR